MQTNLWELPTLAYHNTVPIAGSELQQANITANDQESIILKLYQQYTTLSPWQCLARLQTMGYRWPITSIRRAITNLAVRDGKLRQTGLKIKGPLNHSENVWQIT